MSDRNSSGDGASSSWPWLPLFLRVALGAGFLSAVADRMGFWGPPGSAGVAWGGFDPFLAYTAELNPWAPHALIRPIGLLVTVLEIGLGLALLVGLFVRRASVLGGALLTLFGLGMIIGTGAKSALDASIFAAAGAAFALSRLPSGPLALDRLLAHGTKDVDP